MRKMFFLVLLMHFPFVVYALDDAYVCIAKSATGFRFDDATNTWKSASFDVSTSQYIIKRRFPDNEALGAFGVFLLGAEQPFIFCSVNEERQWLKCDDTHYTHLKFNYSSLRFTHYFEGGYSLVPVGKSGREAFIEIGECSPIE